jgi:hypothetical protein
MSPKLIRLDKLRLKSSSTRKVNLVSHFLRTNSLSSRTLSTGKASLLELQSPLTAATDALDITHRLRRSVSEVPNKPRYSADTIASPWITNGSLTPQVVWRYGFISGQMSPAAPTPYKTLVGRSIQRIPKFCTLIVLRLLTEEKRIHIS